MTLFGYHASHEQFSPSHLLRLVRMAEDAGFQEALCSDHFHPWSEKQGQSGFAFAWLGAALQATSLSFGSVCAPGQRYHPAIVAQAAATLAEMFPERYWIALGSGQLLNEHITGETWPSKAERNARLEECVNIIRRLWAGEEISFKGLVQVDEAKLYTRPENPPLIIGAAITPETAEWVGTWADGLITISQAPDKLQEVINRFYKGGGKGKKLFLKAQHAYAPKAEDALAGAYEQWRNNIFESKVTTELKTPEQFDAAGSLVEMKHIQEHVRVSANLNDHIQWLKHDIEMGFDCVYIHNVNRDQEAFIQAFGKHVIPDLHS
jgi:coenzyme F420-dependent glucose-6-phosphate dehydrogenase